MVIDIDIKIANSNGQLIHRFSKRFDEKAESAEKINNEGLSKDFEDFLAEYLSDSGRSIRDRLMNDPEAHLAAQRMVEKDEAMELYEEESTADDCPDSEMEYKIRIGKDKVIAGKIPFHRLARLNTVKDALERDELSDKAMEEPHRDSAHSSDPFNGTAGSRTKHSTETRIKNRKKDTIGDLEMNLKNLMIQAVEKYESSFYHMGEEPT